MTFTAWIEGEGKGERRENGKGKRKEGRGVEGKKRENVGERWKGLKKGEKAKFCIFQNTQNSSIKKTGWNKFS